MSGWITPPNVVPAVVVVAVIFAEFVGHCLDVAPYPGKCWQSSRAADSPCIATYSPQAK